MQKHCPDCKGKALANWSRHLTKIHNGDKNIIGIACTDDGCVECTNFGKFLRWSILVLPLAHSATFGTFSATFGT
jgi:hypothetical protein